MTGVDYNDDYDQKYYDTMPSLLVFEPQEFSRPLSNAIAIFGANDKSKSVCDRDVAISATGCQYVRTIIEEVQAPSASDHNFNTE